MPLPSHPDVSGGPKPPRSGMSRSTIIVLVVIGALVATVLILHLTGVVGPLAD